MVEVRQFILGYRPDPVRRRIGEREVSLRLILGLEPVRRVPLAGLMGRPVDSTLLPDYPRLEVVRIPIGAPSYLTRDPCRRQEGSGRNTPGPPDLPDGESQRGPQHVGKAGAARRCPCRRPARPA